MYARSDGGPFEVRSGSVRGPFGIHSGSVWAPFGPISEQNFRSQKLKIFAKKFPTKTESVIHRKSLDAQLVLWFGGLAISEGQQGALTIGQLIAFTMYCISLN